jgi:mono/diheme cytochrome c family protein
MFPAGTAADVVTNNCTACHSPGMILNQPPLTATQWRAEVTHMRRDFKAPIAEDDVAAIVAYLSATKDVK